MSSEIQSSASKKRSSGRLKQRFRQEKERLMRLANIGNHSDRLGALTVLAYSFDRVDRNVDQNVIWMNATSQRDARAILDAVRSSRRHVSKLLSSSEFERVLALIDHLGGEVRLEKLERRGIVRPCVLPPLDEQDDEDSESIACEDWSDSPVRRT